MKIDYSHLKKAIVQGESKLKEFRYITHDNGRRRDLEESIQDAREYLRKVGNGQADQIQEYIDQWTIELTKKIKDLNSSRAYDDTQWHEVETILKGIVGCYHEPPHIEHVITDKYSEAMLLGNGDLGVVSDIREGRQVFYLSSSTFWRESGGHKIGIGTMTLKGVDENKNQVSTYQELNILDAKTYGCLSMGRQNHKIETESWVVESENILVTKVWNEAGGENVGDEVHLQVVLESSYGEKYPITSGASANTIWITKESETKAEGDKWLSRAVVCTQIIGEEAVEAKMKGNQAILNFYIKSGKAHAIYLISHIQTIGTAARDAVSIEQLLQRVKTRAQGIHEPIIQQWYEEHVTWWKNYWSKSYVKLNDAQLERYYYGAQYIMGCAARAGNVAPGLWASWNTIDGCNCGGRYYLNYNYQAPFYGVYSSNRVELAECYYQAVLAYMPWAKKAAAQGGYKGLVYPRTLSPMHMVKAHPDQVERAKTKEPKRLCDQKSNGIFAVIPLVWMYDYTGDRDFLEEKIYPVLKGLGAFWTDFLIMEDNRYVVKDSAVNEEGDDRNVALDLGYVRFLFGKLIEFSKVLECDSELIPIWEHYLVNLSNAPTGIYEEMEVFLLAEVISNPIKGNALINKDDQPISLEATVHPTGLLGLDSDPHALQLAKNTLKYMDSWQPGDRGSSINGFPKLFPIASRIGWDGEDLIEKFKAVLNVYMKNNLTVKQAGGGIETSGSTEMINSILLQNHHNKIYVFPVWPKERDAKFVNLRAQGAFVISSELKGGQVQSIQVLSEQGNLLTLVAPWKRPIVVQDQKKNTIEVVQGTTTYSGEVTYSFETIQGETYFIKSVE